MYQELEERVERVRVAIAPVRFTPEWDVRARPGGAMGCLNTAESSKGIRLERLHLLIQKGLGFIRFRQKRRH